MKAINWRDEKLYKITARDYDDPFSRTLGAILYSVTKGITIALGILLVFFPEPRLLGSARTWCLFVLPLAVACGIWAAFSDRRLFLCEIEIYSDRIIRHLTSSENFNWLVHNLATLFPSRRCRSPAFEEG